MNALKSQSNKHTSQKPSPAAIPATLEVMDSSTANELGLAQQIRQDHRLAYNHQLRFFERYNEESGLWELQTDHQIKSHVFAQVARLHSKHYTAIVPLTVTRLVNAICTVLKYTVPEPAVVDTTNLVAVRNGVLEFGDDPTGMKLLKHSPDYFLRNGSPVEYRSSARCSEFLRTLVAKAFDSDGAKLIQKYFGGILLGHNETQQILVIKGTAGIGKSTLVTIMEHVIGVANVAYLRTQHLGGRFEMSSFIGKKLLVGKDVPGNFLSETGSRILKPLVGGDLLQAERKGNNQRVDLYGKYHVVITCNADLSVPTEQDADAWRRRLLVVNSQEPKPSRPIPNLSATLLKKESSGILNWLIEGAIAHRTELAQFGQYQLTARQEREVQNMVQNLGQFKTTN